MAEETVEEEAPKKKRSKLPLLLGVVLALALGGGGFFAVYSGMILASHETETTHADGEEPEPLPNIGFVPMEPIIVSLGEQGTNRHLRLTAQLEVDADHQTDVTLLLPRVLDVLNGYLRALDVAELQDRTALFRLRAQMLRRVQIVTGEGRVRDLLVTEFVLN